MLKGKKTLITGAAGGIGQAIVALFQENGATVAVADRDTAGLNADAHLDGDLRKRAYADDLAQMAADALGGLDIVINNAGIITRGVVTDATDADYANSFAINVEAPFRICRAAIPIMAATGGGAIVNTASCWGIYPGPAHPIYCASKAAIATMTKCMGRDHAHQNIRINAICPNEVNTPMLRSGFEIRGFDADSAVAELNKTVPIGHIAEPQEIADVVLFLASDQSRYICGAAIEINGGKPVF